MIPTTTTARRFFNDESGADVLEYALLSAFIAVLTVAGWISVGPKLKTAYEGWNTNVQTVSSCTPDPGGGGCP